MPRPPTPWADLGPMLQGTWRGQRPAWDCIMQQSVYFQRAAQRSWAVRGHHLRGLEGWEDLYSEVLVRFMSELQRREGLPRPPDWQEREDAGAWLARVARTKVLDAIRYVDNREKRQDSLDEKLEEHGWEPANPDPGPDPLDLIRAQRLERSVIDAIQEGGLAPTQALAWVVLQQPTLLSEDLVERLAEQIPRGHRDQEHGLLRAPVETWLLLQRWMRQHGGDPTSNASRLELAWILRSADGGTPAAWREADPCRAKRARDALRQWENRARAKFAQLEGAEVAR